MHGIGHLRLLTTYVRRRIHAWYMAVRRRIHACPRTHTTDMSIHENALARALSLLTSRGGKRVAACGGGS